MYIFNKHFILTFLFSNKKNAMLLLYCRMLMFRVYPAAAGRSEDRQVRGHPTAQGTE